MKNLDILFDGVCTLLFEFEDGSRMSCLTSLNSDVLKEHNIYKEGLFDLETGREITSNLISHIKDVRCEEDDVNLSDLDIFFNIGGKIGWQN